jgi:hypothetical protein
LVGSLRTYNKLESKVDQEELLSKLDLIEEQARLTLEDYRQHLTKERQHMIIALAKHIRWSLADSAVGDDPEATVRMPS